jgi:hypothetical protein
MKRAAFALLGTCCLSVLKPYLRAVALALVLLALLIFRLTDPPVAERPAGD